MADERREHTRSNIPRILVRVADAESFREEFMGDLSAGGVFVSTHETIWIGQSVEIELLPPGWDDPLSLNGRIVRLEEAETSESGRTGAAVQFQDLGQETSALLAELLAEYSEDPLPEEEEPVWGDEAEWRAEVEQLESDLKAAEKKLKQRDREVSKADKLEALLRAKTVELEKERDELLQDKVALEAEVEASQRAMETEEKLQDTLRENRKLRARMTVVGERAATAQASLEEESRSRQEAESVADQLRKDKEEAEHGLAETEEKAALEIEELRRDHEEVLSEVNGEVDALKERIASADETAQEACQAEDAALREVSVLEAEVVKLGQEAAESKRQLEEVEAKAMKALEELDKVRGKEKALRQQLEKLLHSSEEDVASGAEQEPVPPPPVPPLPPPMPPGEQRATKEVGDDGEPEELEDVEALFDTGEEETPGLASEAEEAEAPAEVAESPGEEAEALAGEADAPAEEAETPEEEGETPEELELAPPVATEVRDTDTEAPEPSPPDRDAQSSVSDDAAATGEGHEDLIERAQEILSEVSQSDSEEPVVPVEAPSVRVEEPAPVDPPKEKPKAKKSARKKKKKVSSSVRSIEEFERRLQDGAVLERTERFSRLEPVSRTDIQVSDWLKETGSLGELRELSDGKMPEPELVRILFLFYQRSLLELSE